MAGEAWVLIVLAPNGRLESTEVYPVERQHALWRDWGALLNTYPLVEGFRFLGGEASSFEEFCNRYPI